MTNRYYRTFDLLAPIKDSKLTEILISIALSKGYSVKTFDDCHKKYGRDMQLENIPLDHYIYLGRLFPHELKFGIGMVHTLFVNKGLFRTESRLSDYLKEVTRKTDGRI